MTDLKLINAVPGDELDAFLLLTKLEVKRTKNNKEYLNLEFRDKTASITAKMWDNFEFLLSSIKQGDVLKVKAVVDEYSGQLQLVIKELIPLKGENNIDPVTFLPSSQRDFNQMTRELQNRIEAIKNKPLKKLIQTILSGENLNLYSKVPAGKSWHHSYLHGLLEHVLEVIKICDLMCDIHPRLNRDLLITGAILHDFGKIEELEFDTGFDYSDKGRLLGHIAIGALEISSVMDKMKTFPDDLRQQLLHLILSHQGKLEYASPVEPKTIEAIVLYYADELSAKTNAYKLVVENETDSGKRWTNYIPLAKTSLFIGENKKEENNEEGSLFRQ